MQQQDPVANHIPCKPSIGVPTMSHTYHLGFVSSHHLKSEILDCPFWRIPTCHHPRMSSWNPFSLHGPAISICCRHMNPLWKHFYFLYAETLCYHVQGSLIHYHPMFRCHRTSGSLSWMRPTVVQGIPPGLTLWFSGVCLLWKFHIEK